MKKNYRNREVCMDIDRTLYEINLAVISWVDCPKGAFCARQLDFLGLFFSLKTFLD